MGLVLSLGRAVLRGTLLCSLHREVSVVCHDGQQIRSAEGCIAIRQTLCLSVREHSGSTLLHVFDGEHAVVVATGEDEGLTHGVSFRGCDGDIAVDGINCTAK